MNFGEVFTSLQQGVIDAQENPLSIIYSSRLYEVQPYLTIWNYSYDPLILAMNLSRWNRFPPADRKLLMESAREAMDYQRAVVEEEDRTLPRLLTQKGMRVTRLTGEEVRRFREMVQPVYDEYTPRIGEQVVRECLEDVSRGKQKN